MTERTRGSCQENEEQKMSGHNNLTAKSLKNGKNSKEICFEKYGKVKHWYKAGL